MISLEKIDNGNIDEALRLNAIIFPKYCAKNNYLESLEGKTNSVFWIVKAHGQSVGISGIYILPSDPSSAWLGWFGMLPEARRKGYGQEAIALFEQEAKKRGCLYARLFTNRFHNDGAFAFYQSQGYSFEPYTCPDDKGWKRYPIVIFSKSLSDKPLIPWNDRNIHFNEQIAKQVYDK
jgi:GNAT superfamily N-acetyltransferase